MSRSVFPYGIRFQQDGRVEVFPAVELLVHGRRGRGLRAIFHIDSGATTSILPADDAPVLGVSLARGKMMLVRGIGGETFTGYRHEIAVRLDGKKLRIPIIFVQNVSVPRVLGREGMFSLFAIMIDESKRRVAFLDSRSDRTAIDGLF